MGLLTIGGEPLVWGTPANVRAIPYVLEHGISQFLLLFDRFKDDSGRPFLWGEEIEALVVQYGTTDDSDVGGPQFRDAPKRTVRIALSAAELLEELGHGATGKDAVWHPEYGSYMIESTPFDPYTADSVEAVLAVEVNLRRRYEDSARVAANHNQSVVTLTAFPLMGRPDFIAQGGKLHTRGEYADSLFVPDEVTNGTHPRFKNLTRNIRLRRGRKVCIQVPMYLDKHTLSRAVDPAYRIDRHPANKDIDCAPDLNAAKTGAFEDSSSSDVEEETLKKPHEDGGKGGDEKKFKAEFQHLFTPATHYYYAQYLNRAEQQQLRVRERFDACPCPVPAVSHPCVYMDGMAFGMGMCCLQVTMQLADLAQARHVYDQLAVVCPAFLALSSATPVQKGMLCDSDVRWLTISASVDDRKRDEVPRIVKSRYDHISCFISDRTRHLEAFNDDHVEMDPTVLERLKAHGIDERLASHFAHLFIRDPLVIFDKLIDVDDMKTSVHFENIQSTNWQSLRFKPPPMEGGPGWRVEFRVMDIQLTPFENAAFSVFVALLTRAFIKYDSFLYVPMSMVDENMGRAHLRDPVNSQKFWARKSNTFTDAKPSTDDYAEYTVNELFNGSPAGPEGYIPLVRRYIVEEMTHGGPVPPRLDAYLRLLSRRASGELQTTASFLRSFVQQHPAYQHDSIIAPEIACDMVKMAEAIARGEVAFDNFLPQDILMEARKRDRETQ